MKKVCIALVMLVVVALFSCLPAFAHSGRTDSNGGHYDHSTGEYHYHHGYSAHQHENGVCPYDSNDNSYSSDTADNDLPIWEKILAFPVTLVFLVAIFFAIQLLFRSFGSIVCFISFLIKKIKQVPLGTILACVVVILGYILITSISFLGFFLYLNIETSILICLGIIVGALGIGLLVGHFLFSQKDSSDHKGLTQDRVKAGFLIGIILIPIIAFVFSAPVIISNHEPSDKSPIYTTKQPDYISWTWEGFDYDIDDLSSIAPEPSITQEGG